MQSLSTSRPTRRRRAALALAALLSCGGAAAAPLTMWDFALFGGGGAATTNGPDVDIGTNVVVHGMVGSNEDVRLLGNAVVHGSVYAGRDLTVGSNASIGSAGNPVLAVANGVADINGYVFGDLHSGSSMGPATPGTGAAVTMLLRQAAAGTTEITGSVYTQNDLRFNAANNIQITGNATVGQVIQNLGSNSIGGTASTGSTAGLQAFSALAMPGPTAFVASTIAADDRSCAGAMCTSITIAPGTYRDLNIGNSKELLLSSGDYYFRSINTNGGARLFLDLSSGQPLNIYVVGNASFGSNQEIWVMRPGDAVYTRISSLADPSVASLVYLETHAQFSITGGSEWAGSVYASMLELAGSHETFVGSNVTAWGAFYAYDTVDVAGGTTINFVQSYRGITLNDTGTQQSGVPEPGGLALVATGLLGVGLLQRTRRRREPASA